MVMNGQENQTWLTLNNGVRMPQFGLGVYSIPAGDVTYNSVKTALECGYRHIDTPMPTRTSRVWARPLPRSSSAGMCRRASLSSPARRTPPISARKSNREYELEYVTRSSTSPSPTTRCSKSARSTRRPAISTCPTKTRRSGSCSGIRRTKNNIKIIGEQDYDFDRNQKIQAVSSPPSVRGCLNCRGEHPLKS